MKTHTLAIKGMGSNHCVMVVKNIIGRHNGADIESIEIGSATIRLDETQTSKEAVVEAIEKMGYKVES
jgi:copper chaperone CopZ